MPMQKKFYNKSFLITNIMKTGEKDNNFSNKYKKQS